MNILSPFGWIKISVGDKGPSWSSLPSLEKGGGSVFWYFLKMSHLKTVIFVCIITTTHSCEPPKLHFYSGQIWSIFRNFLLVNFYNIILHKSFPLKHIVQAWSMLHHKHAYLFDIHLCTNIWGGKGGFDH